MTNSEAVVWATIGLVVIIAAELALGGSLVWLFGQLFAAAFGLPPLTWLQGVAGWACVLAIRWALK